MKTRSMLSRRVLAGVAAIALSGTLVTAVNTESAGAVSYSGVLGGHGLGTVFARSGQILANAVSSAATATYTFNVYNVGSAPAQFLVRVLNYGAATPTVKTGSVDVSYNAVNDGWYTNVIPANKLQTFTVAVKMPVGSPPEENDLTVRLSATDGSTLAEIYTVTYIKAAAKGVQGTDVYIKGTGGQFIGGPSFGQVACSTVLKGNTHTAFTMQVQNDSTSNSQPIIYILDNQGNGAAYPLKVTLGGKDITSSFMSTGWVSPVLKPGAKEVLTVTATNVAANSQGNLYHVVSFDNMQGGTSDSYIEVNGDV